MPMTAQLAAAMKSTLRVLVVEDDARYRGMLLTMLRDLSCEPIAISSAPEALQFLFPTPIEQDPQSGFDLVCAKKGK